MHQTRLGIHADEQTVDSRQNLLGQLVLFQPMAKAQDGAFVRHPAMRIELGKLAVQGDIKESLLHGRVRQGKPLLHEVHPEHRLQGKKAVAHSCL